MAGIQITPSGVGQTGMIIAAIVGVVLVIDSIMFMNDAKTLLNYAGINVYLDEKVRAVALILVGGLIFMFGLGFWTVGVGAIAIATIAVLTYGSQWGAQGWKGTNQTRTTTVQTKQAQTQHEAAAQQNKGGVVRYRCPLNRDELAWCLEDYNRDGILNKDDRDPPKNCTFKSKVGNTKISNQCKVVK